MLSSSRSTSPEEPCPLKTSHNDSETTHSNNSTSTGRPPTYAPLCVYPTHWSLTPLTKTQHPHFISTFIVDDVYTIQVMLNPTDSRGYRSIVYLSCPEDPKSVLNRPFTLPEQMAVHKALAVVAQAYSRFGMIPQVELAGNNSHAFNPETATTTIGAVEPCFLHGHVIGRGDPNEVFIDGSRGNNTSSEDRGDDGRLTLGGPLPGELFDMREGKRPWRVTTPSTTVGEDHKPHINNRMMIAIATIISEQLWNMKDEAAKHNIHILAQ